MAAGNPSPSGGFSYAQAAKGRSSAATTQTPPSKVTSGAATPATGTFSELTSGSDWADDVEASVKGKLGDEQKVQQEESKSFPKEKENSVENVKADDKMLNGTSGVSSPDLTASVSTTTREDESTSSAPTAPPSDSTSETKSQVSEPAWISERKERQSTSQAAEKPVKGEKKTKDSTPAPVKPVILQDALPPPVNPWMKRAEENRAKVAAQPKINLTQSSASQANTQKENQRPQMDSRKKANSIASVPQDSQGVGDELKKPASTQPKRGNEARNSNSRPTSKHAPEDNRQDSLLNSSARTLTSERQSLPNLTTAPPPVKDQVAWPKPDITQEPERKDSVEKEADEKRSDESTPATKRKKPEWTSMAVEPNIIWETPSMNEPKGPRPRGGPSGERGARGGRGGNGGRGRGGHGGVPNGEERRPSRSGPSGPSPSQDNETSTTARHTSNPTTREHNSQSKAHRTSSVSPRRGQKSAIQSERSAAGQSLAGTATHDNITPDGPTNLSATADSFVTPSTEARRSKSPFKPNAANMEDKEDVIIPAPIPRRNSIGTQTEEANGVSESSTREEGLVRRVPSTSHKDTRTFENGRDATWNAPRGGKRGGRGRGGNAARDMVNGHSTAHAFANNYENFTSQFGGPQSPAYQTPRGSHQYSYPPPGRGGYQRTPRSPSLPLDNYYNARFGAPYGAQPPMTPMQTYSPGMYDMSNYPMSAMPYAPQMEPHFLMEMVTTQVEYYFSVDNLLKDLFLRKNMDSQGFVFLDVIANFNRLKSLTQDRDLLKIACINSKTIEIRVGEDGKERLRKREGWQQFLLPEDQREASARTSGPEHLERPERPQLSLNNVPPQFRGPASAGLPSMHQRQDRRSYDSSYPVANGYQTQQFTPFTPYATPSFEETVNGEEHRGRTTKSPIHENGVPPMEPPVAGVADESDKDVFPNDQINILNVVVRARSRIPFHSAASRTFSNGSIDSRSIMAEMEKPAADAHSAPLTNGETSVDGTEHKEILSRQASPNGTSSDGRSTTGDVQVLWVKDQDQENFPTADKLPPDLSFEPYYQIRSRGLEQREHAATGNCPYDLQVLYQFWCHFLIRNFNNSMYAEFKRYANEDAKERHEFTGLRNLAEFYSKSLASSNLIPNRVAQDYADLVKNEPAGLESAAYKSLRGAWRNGALNLKNRKTLSKFCDEALKEQLDKTEP